MSFFEVEFTLPEQDSYLEEVEKQIQKKRNFLLERQRQLDVASKENQFLSSVKEDYQKYQNFMMKQKDEQIKSMQIIDQYLNDLMVSGKMTGHDINETKKDQREILSEIDKIKKDLDEMMK